MNRSNFTHGSKNEIRTRIFICLLGSMLIFLTLFLMLEEIFSAGYFTEFLIKSAFIVNEVSAPPSGFSG